MRSFSNSVIISIINPIKFILLFNYLFQINVKNEIIKAD